jgi:hypothetical protein
MVACFMTLSWLSPRDWRWPPKPVISLSWLEYLRISTRESQKVKELFQEKHTYCKYTETKLISLFIVIPLNFISPLPAFHKFFLIPSGKRSLVASLTKFGPRQFLERIITAYQPGVRHYEPESKAQSMVWKRPTWPVAKKFKSQPSAG